MARGFDFCCGIAVDMDLPSERLQRREVAEIAAVRLACDPRQPVASVNRASAAFAQAAFAIVHSSLRDGAKHEAAERWEVEKERHHQLHDVQAHQPRESARTGHTGESPVSGRYQATSKSDSFRLVAIKERRAGMALQNRSEFPRQVDGIADACIHALPAHGTVDVRCIAQQKRAALAKMFSNTMVDPVGREPVHALDVDTHPLKHSRAHIIPGKILALVFRFVAQGTDQPGTPFVLQWEDGEKIGPVQTDVDLPIHHWSAAFHVGDIEDVTVFAAAKWNLEGLARGGVRAVASRNIGGPARLGCSVRAFQACENVAFCLLKSGEFRLARNFDTSGGQARDQQTFVLILRKDQRIGERAESGAHVAKDEARDILPGSPEMNSGSLPPALDDRVSDPHLAVKLERAGLDNQGP